MSRAKTDADARASQPGPPDPPSTAPKTRRADKPPRCAYCHKPLPIGDDAAMFDHFAAHMFAGIDVAGARLIR